MSSISGNNAEFSLGSPNDSTGWIDQNAIVEDIAFNITGTWSGTIQLQASNQPDVTKTRYSTITSYTANQAPLNIPRSLARYIRLIFTNYVSGTAYVGFSKGIDSKDQLVDMRPQASSNEGTSTFA